jgi:hypothetical protein
MICNEINNTFLGERKTKRSTHSYFCRSQGPSSLRRWFAAARLLLLQVSFRPGDMGVFFVCVVCCQLEVLGSG